MVRKARAAVRTRPDDGVVWAALALVVLGGLAYANSLGGPFVLDDLLSIRDNPHIRVLWPPAHWLSLEPQSSLSGRPLVTLSMALCHAVAGLDVRVYHGFNVAVHLSNGVLLLGLLRVHLAARAAFAGALLWTVHPLNTEAVNYLTQRTELLLGTFYLGTLFAVARGRRGVAILCCGLGMLCKESMVTAPVAVLLWERVYRFDSWRELFARRRGFYAALAGTWGVLVAVLLLAPRSQSVGFELGVSAFDYARSQLVAVAHYLSLAVWPDPLAIHYGPVQALALGDVIVPGIAVGAALAGALVLFWRAPRAGYPAVLFFLLLAPTSSFVPIATEVAAERRMYLPLAAFVALGIVAALAVGRFARASYPAATEKRIDVLAWLATVALALALGSATYARNVDYASAVALWQSSVDARPNLSQGFVNLGIALAERGDSRDAAAAYRDALALDPGDARAHYDLALALDSLGELDSAVANLERAVALEPRFEAARLALARALIKRGDIEEALEHARAASAATGDRDPAVLHTLAAAEWAAGLREQAVRTQTRALEVASGGSPGLVPGLAEQLTRYRESLAD